MLGRQRDLAAATSHKDGTLPPDGAGGGIDCHNSLIGCNGLFWRNSYFGRSSFKDIIDGPSKTLMVGESVVEQDYHSAAFFADGDWASCNVPLNFFIVGADERQHRTTGTRSAGSAASILGSCSL